MLEKSCKNVKLPFVWRNYFSLMNHQTLIPVALITLLLAACGTPSSRPVASAETIAQAPRAMSEKGNEVVLYALGLIDTGYRFGGKNPQAGLDCSGMVSHIYQTTLGLKVKGSAADSGMVSHIYDVAAGMKVAGSAADIAKISRPIERDSLRPGDLVFFNTRNQAFSHVGIYIGDARFVHAPSTNGKVRIDRLSDRYYAQRYESARTFFD